MLEKEIIGFWVKLPAVDYGGDLGFGHAYTGSYMIENTDIKNHVINIIIKANKNPDGSDLVINNAFRKGNFRFQTKYNGIAQKIDGSKALSDGKITNAYFDEANKKFYFTRNDNESYFELFITGPAE